MSFFATSEDQQMTYAPSPNYNYRQSSTTNLSANTENSTTTSIPHHTNQRQTLAMNRSKKIKASERVVSWIWDPIEYPYLTNVPTQDAFRQAIDQIHLKYGKDPHSLMMTIDQAYLIHYALEFANEREKDKDKDKSVKSPEQPYEYNGSSAQWANFCISIRRNYRLGVQSKEKFYPLSKKSEFQIDGKVIITWKNVTQLEELYNILTKAHTNGGTNTHISRDKMIMYLKENDLDHGIKTKLINTYLSLCPAETCSERREKKHMSDYKAATNRIENGVTRKTSFNKRKAQFEENIEAPESKRYQSEIVHEGRDPYSEPAFNPYSGQRQFGHAEQMRIVPPVQSQNSQQQFTYFPGLYDHNTPIIQHHSDYGNLDPQFFREQKTGSLFGTNDDNLDPQLFREQETSSFSGMQNVYPQLGPFSLPLQDGTVLVPDIGEEDARFEELVGIKNEEENVSESPINDAEPSQAPESSDQFSYAEFFAMDDYANPFDFTFGTM